MRLGLTSGWPEVAEVIGTRWKMCFDSPILWPSPLAIARGSQGRPGWGLGPLAYLVGPQRNDRERAFVVSYALLDGNRRFETSYPTFYSEKQLGFSRKGVEVKGDFVKLQSIIGLGLTLGRLGCPERLFSLWGSGFS